MQVIILFVVVMCVMITPVMIAKFLDRRALRAAIEESAAHKRAEEAKKALAASPLRVLFPG
jgi:hypothetical protein